MNTLVSYASTLSLINALVLLEGAWAERQTSTAAANKTG